MSLSLALNTALTGLQVNQRTMALISNNIANANTEGYSRQTHDLASITVNGVGSGVRIEDVSRKVDTYLQESIYRQSGNVGYADAIHEYYETMQILLGDPALGNSIDEHIETFFNDLQQMAETPERSSTRAAVIESATIMAREISNLAEGLERLRWQADQELDNSIQILNQKMEDLFYVNEAIAEADAYGTPTATLKDQRDLLVEEIAEYIDIRVNEQENGVINVYAGSGVNLIDFAYSRIEYNEVTNLGTLVEDGELNPVILQNIDASGNNLGLPINIVSGGTSSQIESRFTGGRLAGLLAIRDDIIPNMLTQLDELASQMRDSFNAIHNQGSGYPAATELEGTALYQVGERSEWEGTVQIAALNEDGTPISSPFNDELSAFRPLNMDLTTLFSGTTIGEPDVQTIIDEINNHFGVPQNRLQVGNLNNVQLALVSDVVPGATPTIEFDFDIENISGNNADFWVDSIQVLDDGAVDITSTTNTIPTIALSPGATFITTAASTTVTVTTALNHGLSDGDMVRLNDPGVAIDGIPGVNFDGYFTISNVTATTFEITVAVPAAAGATTGVAAQTISPPYETVPAGIKQRLQPNGTISADLSANSTSTYYDINVDIVTRDVTTGTLSTTTVTYRVLNPQTDTMNDRISARAVPAGTGVLTTPDDLRPILRAMLVDEDGNELQPSTGGDYGNQSGYLRIESLREGVTFAIDDSTTRHLGLSTDVPPRAGDDRGFSHHFGLNNFFTNNELTATGDTLKNSAINFAIENRLRENPSLVSTGNLQLSNQPAGSGAVPLYTYERYSGDGSIVQQLAGLGIVTQSFDSAGGLPDTELTFNAYAGEILAYIAANTIGAERTMENESILLDGYIERADAISGVNLDEELANTVIYQNAYSASARVISITDELFETLLGVL